jgi:hypothetical protein
MTLLQERTVLACLHIGVWSGMMRDQDVNEEVAVANNADASDAGSYSKRLVSRKEMVAVHRQASVLSRTHKLLTLPWEDGGVRILSTRTYMAYTEQMRMAKLGFQAAVDQFNADLPRYIEAAKPRLGKMFKSEDYPTPEAIAKKFWVDVEIKQVTNAKDFRAELSNETTKAIVKDIERRTEQRLNEAMNNVFERVIEKTTKMVDKLRAYKVNGDTVENDFKGTLVWNIKELAELLPSLNITDDKRLDEIHQKLLDDLAAHSPEVLKDNESIRLKTADKAEKLLKKVQSYLV